MSISNKIGATSSMTAGNGGSLTASEKPKVTDLQQTAWNLGNDKGLSNRIVEDLRANADTFIEMTSGRASIKQFREDMQKGLEKNGVGEKDAINLLDQFIASEFSEKDEMKSLKDALSKTKQPMAGAVSTESEAPRLPVSTQQTAWDLGTDKKMSTRVLNDLIDNGITFSDTAKNATMKDFRNHMVSELTKHGVGEQDANSLIDQLAEYAGADDKTTLNKALGDAQKKPIKDQLEAEAERTNKRREAAENSLKGTDDLKKYL